MLGQNIANNNLYKYRIWEIINDFNKAGKQLNELNNYDLAKVFEYYSCIRLTDEFKRQFYMYDDIDPDYKENNKMSDKDTGIDFSDLLDFIGQAKLRSKSLTLSECATAISSIIGLDDYNNIVTKWKLIITRNKCSTLSSNLQYNSYKFIDKTYDKAELLGFIQTLISNPPSISTVQPEIVELRDYQKECIDLIRNLNKNIAICLPTGAGKNFIIIKSMLKDKKYLILVPWVVLLKQNMDSIKKYTPYLVKDVQIIGDGKSKYNKDKNITLCVYNSINRIENMNDFEKIFIDEAHRVDPPEIYTNEDIISDDDDDSYIDKIASLSSLNNNVYLSATLDPIDGFEYYKKDIRNMITQGHISDYKINIPIFDSDPSDRNICAYLIKNYKHCIIYCKSRKEGNKINIILNSILPNSSKYIDCKTPIRYRDTAINEFKKGIIPFLVNVRTLFEGFDASITSSICFMHLPSSETMVIQAIGRALRKHENKTYANIILPFNREHDDKAISKFIRIVANNDYRLKKSFTNRSNNGYINIYKVSEENDNSDNTVEDSEVELRYNIIIDSMGNIENNKELWFFNCGNTREFLTKNKGTKLPSISSEDEYEKRLSIWVSNQKHNSKDGERKKAMKDDEIFEEWKKLRNEYPELFFTYKELWFFNCGNTRKFVTKNKGTKLPNISSKDEYERKLSSWVYTQKHNSKDGERKKAMKDDEIYEEWKKLRNEYPELFFTLKEVWFFNCGNTRKFVTKNKGTKLPNISSKDEYERKLSSWVYTQKENSKDGERKKAMKDNEIFEEWKKLKNEYPELFK